MPAIRLFRFDGMRPAWDDRLLEETQAALCNNCYLYSGALQGWIQPTLIWSLKNTAAARVYRIPQSQQNIGITAPSYWLEFTDPDTDVIRSPVVDDVYQRYYFASPSQAPQYNTLSRIAAGGNNQNAPFLLGIPKPICSPGITVTGGANASTTRSYAITWVTAYGEESGPSDFSISDGFADSTWTLTLTPPTQAADTNKTATPTRNIQFVNIYRTVTSAAGSAVYFFVTQQPIATTTYIDNNTDDTVALNNQLQTIGWGPPPSDLQGFVSMPNGFFAGFRQNEVWFSQPFYPHAWPTSFILTTKAPIVGLGVTGNTLVAATQGAPEAFTGLSPGVMSPVSIGTTSYPCTSRGSIVGADQGVFFTSPAGLVLVTPAGFPTVFTEGWITREKWSTLTPPVGVRAINLLSSYFAFGTVHTVPGSYATGTITVAAGNLSPGDALSIGGHTYTMVNGASATPDQITIGASVVQTVFNITDAINNQGQYNSYVYGVEYGGGTVQNAYASASNDGVSVVTLTALSFGSVGNGVALSTTGANAILSGGALTGGHDSTTDNSNAQVGFTIDFGTATNAVRWLGFGLLGAPSATDIKNVSLDPWTGVALLTQGGSVYQYDWSSASPIFTPYKWRSKIFKQTWKRNFEAVKIHFTVPATTPLQESTRNLASPQTLASNQYGILRVYAGPLDPDAPLPADASQVPDTTAASGLSLVCTRDIFNTGEILRIPSGAKYTFWQFEVEARVVVSSMEVATSVQELRQI